MKKNKATTVFLTLVITTLTGLALFGVLAIDNWIIGIGIGVAVMSAVFVRMQTVPSGVEAMLRAGGYVLLGLAFFAFFSPTFAGMRETYLTLPNILMLLEASIILLLHGNDGRATKAVQIAPAAYLNGFGASTRRTTIVVK